MGKGDQRSRRGKIHRGTFGRRRPKRNKGASKTGRRSRERAEEDSSERNRGRRVGVVDETACHTRIGAKRGFAGSAF